MIDTVVGVLARNRRLDLAPADQVALAVEVAHAVQVELQRRLARAQVPAVDGLGDAWNDALAHAAGLVEGDGL